MINLHSNVRPVPQVGPTLLEPTPPSPRCSLRLRGSPGVRVQFESQKPFWDIARYRKHLARRRKGETNKLDGMGGGDAWNIMFRCSWKACRKKITNNRKEEHLRSLPEEEKKKKSGGYNYSKN
ncbi:hypothetical protein CEXT_695691 [Caerostris extrusa]|uniref:Uncharacterized protein n=1 Tax=Caerostris extrusa TaxID=172846 RepID=A0AAV4YE97_CAEEX|nr:hypothetical protein CEXT_695691 [Caerostris extrusa]